MNKEINSHHFLQKLQVINGYKIDKYLKKENNTDIYSKVINRHFDSEQSEAVIEGRLKIKGLKLPDFNDYYEPEYIDMEFFKRQIRKNPKFKEKGFTFYNGRKYITVDSRGKIIG